MTTTHDTPEKSDLTLGFIPLTDCCVLVIAKEKGFFAEEGLNVTLSREASWANIRDKVCVGALDGAHMLAGMPIATRLGLGFIRKNLVTAFSMNLNGNAITLSNKLTEQLQEISPYCFVRPMASAETLKQVIEQRKQDGQPPLRFAMVYPYSNHNYELRYWLAAGGIDPENDIQLTVIPPQFMAANLNDGGIDGFCVGAPWNSYTASQGFGKIVLAGYEIWNNSPEKVFAVTEDWAEKYPATHLALLRALIKATRWIEEANDPRSLSELLARKEYINVPADAIYQSLFGIATAQETKPMADFNVFHRYLANFPWCSHAAWILTQMYRWGQLEEPVNFKEVAESVYKPDIYRTAAAQLDILTPESNYKNEGSHAESWTLAAQGREIRMGADLFMDGKQFNPEKITDYLEEMEIHNLRVDMQTLKAINR